MVSFQVTKYLLCALFIGCLLSVSQLALSRDTTQIKFLDNSNIVNNKGKYYADLLKLALEKSEPEFGHYSLKPVQANMRQERQFISLDENIIDVVWTATSVEREKMALPIRIPLLKGLIGHRVFVIRKTDVDRFAQVDSLQQLAKLKAVQGQDWPDVEILEGAGLKVESIKWRESLYKMVSSGIVDYFPRSVLEIHDEWKSVDQSSLIVEPKHLLIYPSAMYFFVQKDQKGLAQRITLGLKKAIQDGSFDRLLWADETHQKALSAFLGGGRTVHQIPNPLLPPDTPLHDDALWFTPLGDARAQD